MLIGVKCSESEENKSFSECHQCALTGKNKCNFNDTMILGMERAVQNRTGISATNLLGCLRSVYLQRIYDYYSPLENLWWSFRGQMFHLIAEKGKNKDTIVEVRFEKKINGVLITGQIDVLRPLIKRIEDYKTVAEVPAYNYPFKKHTAQVNIYRYLCYDKYPTDELAIYYMSMKSVKRLFAKVWSLEETENYIKKPLEILNNAFSNGIVPEMGCLDVENSWQRSYCPVVDVCEKLREKELTEKITKELMLKIGTKSLNKEVNKVVKEESEKFNKDFKLE